MIFRFTLSNDIKGSYLLPHDPIGWDDCEATISRGQEYHGTFYQTTVDLKFYCGAGKEYIKEVYDTYGIDAIVNIKIEISCPCQEDTITDVYTDEYTSEYGFEEDGNCNWQTFYEGILDFNSLSIEDEYISCNIINDSFFERVRNRLDTVVDMTDTISIDNTTIDTITESDLTLHSKAIQYDSSWTTCGPIFYDNYELQACYAPVDTMYATVPIVSVNNASGLEFDVCAADNHFILNCEPTPILWTEFADDFFFHNETNNTLIFTLNYDFKGYFNFKTYLVGPISNDCGYILNIYKSSALIISDPAAPNLTVYNVFNYLQPLIANANNVHNFDFSGTLNITLLPGEKLYMGAIWNSFPTNPSNTAFSAVLAFEEFDINFKWISQIEETTCKVYKNHDIGHQIARNITGYNDSFRSEILGNKITSVQYIDNGCNSYNVVTNGFKIREFDKVLRSSMNDWFMTNKMLYNLGLGIEKFNDNYVVRVEPVEYFYDKSTILTFDYVPDIKKTMALNLYYSNINIGYEEWEVEEINGLDEFNTRRQYNTGIRKSTNTLSINSPYIASGYAIEFTRRNGQRFTSNSDWKYDNNNFIIAVNRTLDGNNVPVGFTTAEKDENYSYTNNLLDPNSIYNLRLAPTKALLRHLNVINPNLLKYPGREIKFTYGEANIDVEYDDTEPCDVDYIYRISERSNIQWDSINFYKQPIWIPEYVEFEYPLSYDQWLTLKDNPTKCIAFSKGNTGHEKGFIINCAYKPTRGIASFKLLIAYDN